MMKLAPLIKDYETYHRTRGNHVCHFIGIPMIAVGALGSLSYWVYGGVDLGIAFWAAFGFVVFILDWRVALSFNLATLGLYFISRELPLPLHLGLLVAGLVLQLVGHSHYERNRPALLTNLAHFVVGPIWVFMQSVKSRKP